MNRERMEQLAAHLRSGRLHYKWDFATFRSLRRGQSCGCAVGELAKLCGLTRLDELLDQSGARPEWRAVVRNIRQEVQTALDISEAEFDYLFVPLVGCDSAERHWLTEQASAAEVADLITHYLRTGEFLRRTDDELEALRHKQELLRDESEDTVSVSNHVPEIYG